MKVLTFLVATTEILVGTTAKADIFTEYTVNIRQTTDQPLLHFSLIQSASGFAGDRSTFRLWGADIRATLPSEILTGEFQCRDVGYFLSDLAGYVRIAKCDGSGVDLSRTLISLGLAVEICSESNGAYGTCKE